MFSLQPLRAVQERWFRRLGCEHVFVHAPEIRLQALALVEQGVNDCEIARRLGVPRPTVRDWRKPHYMARHTATCPRCWRRSPPVVLGPQDYAELLGLYLGDGHITAMPRTQRLRLFLDNSYPSIVAETEALLRRAFPHNHVSSQLRHGGSMIVLCVYHQHLVCLFPQHGAGKKHDRRLLLEPWQATIVESAPWAFLRGCIRSDGCMFINRTGPYRYLSYDFANLSTDLLDLFARTAELAGLHPRRYPQRVRLCRRADVRRIAAEIGPKT